MKGVSDMDAQKNKKKEGNKNEAKKPIQVLHLSKKDTTLNGGGDFWIIIKVFQKNQKQIQNP